MEGLRVDGFGFSQRVHPHLFGVSFDYGSYVSESNLGQFDGNEVFCD